MQEIKYELKSLTNALMEEVVGTYGLLEVSPGQYRTACNKIIKFAASLGQVSYPQDLVKKICRYIDIQVEEGCMCPGVPPSPKKILRLLESLAETGEVDFSNAKPSVRKYPVSKEILALAEDSLDTNGISKATSSDLGAPMRHLFRYADNHGYNAE